jgi:hypothetical protein
MDSEPDKRLMFDVDDVDHSRVREYMTTCTGPVAVFGAGRSLQSQAADLSTGIEQEAIDQILLFCRTWIDTRCDQYLEATGLEPQTVKIFVKVHVDG